MPDEPYPPPTKTGPYSGPKPSGPIKPDVTPKSDDPPRGGTTKTGKFGGGT